MIALGALALVTCHRAPSVTALEPVQRLLQTPGAVPWSCAADDETRPALGCVPSLLVATELGVAHDGTTFRRRYPLPASVPAGRYVLEPMVKFGDREGWQMLAPSVAGVRTGEEIELPFSLPPGTPDGPVDLGVRARPVPPPTQSTDSQPVRVGTGAVLRVGIALESIGNEAAAAPVEFTLVGRSDRDQRELVRAVLDPGNPAARRWNDYRIDLAPFVNHSVRFTFSTRVVPRAGESADESFSFPLWGAPEILEPRPQKPGQPNVILISLDTLRADHLGVYGCELPTSPVIDRFAGEGTLFEQTVAAYPSTPASHMTMMTGVYPAVHGVVGPLDRLPPDIPTLAEQLAAAGYETAAVTEDGMLVGASGFSRGFSYYRENKGASIWDASGQVDVTFPAGLRWVEAHRGEKYFLFLHTYQVHEPYSPPPAFDVFRTYRNDGKETPISDATPLAIRNRHLYAGEVRFVDSEFGRLLEGLAALGEAERTLIVVTSDHGEEFYEHGWKGHDESLYEEVLRVALILHAPRLVPPGLRIPVQVSLADLTPTVLDLLGLPVPATAQGKSLVPLLKDPSAPAFANRVAFAELVKKRQPYLKGARAGGLMWIFPEVAGRAAEVYDLAKDPGEHTNIATPALREQGEVLIRQYQTAASTLRDRLAGKPADRETVPPPLDTRTVEKLRALGYVQ